MNRIESTLSLTLLLSSASFSLFAQQPPPASAAPGSAPAPAAPPRAARAERHIVFGNAMDDHHERGLGFVPAGAWWRDPETIKSLDLTAEQQKRLEEIFHQNRIQLIHLKASLEEEQVNLEPLVNANPVDTTKALAEITRIADLRADLEKANAKMLLGLRGALTAEQWTKLQTERRHILRLGPLLQNHLDLDQFESGVGKGIGPINLQSFNMPAIHIPAQHFSKRDFPGVNVPEINIPPIDIPEMKVPEIHIPKAVVPQFDSIEE